MSLHPIVDDYSDNHDDSHVLLARMLQDTNHRGRTVLTVLYLCVLSTCFLIPVFFYARMHCDDRRNRRLREMEMATITHALAESQTAQQQESNRATRRKYREERRARILQLFGPVRMILKEENFVDTKAIDPSNASATPIGDNDDNKKQGENSDVEAPSTETSRDRIERGDKSSGDAGDDDDDDDDGFVLIPAPGLPSGARLLDFLTSASSSYNNLQSSNHSGSNRQDLSTSSALRQVPIECSICLCEYTVGSDVVWSSNPQCEHVFHEKCIEQWLMKQREGPLCPCCRRDFVIDPFDDAEALIETVPTDITEDGGMGVDATIQTVDSDAISVLRVESSNEAENEQSSGS